MRLNKDLKNIADIALKERYWKFPDNIKSRKAKAAYIYFKIFYTIGVGKGQVIGRYTNMLPEIMGAIFLFEKITSINISPSIVGFVLIGSFVGSWLIGYFWMRHDFDRVDSQVSSERNLYMQEIHKEIVKKRRKM